MEPVIMELAEVGASLMEICVAVGIVRETAYDWMRPESDRYCKEFSDTIRAARAVSQAWWEKKGRENVGNKDFNTALFNKQIAGRFPDDWRDTSTVRKQYLDDSEKPVNPPFMFVPVGGDK
jgi:hypothetical protein